MKYKIKEYNTGKTNKTRYEVKLRVGTYETTDKPKYDRKKGFKTYQDAEKYCKRQLKAIKNGTYGAKKRYRVKELYKVWLTDHKREISSNTVRLIDSVYKNHISKDIGAWYIDKITPFKLRSIVNNWFSACGYVTATMCYTYTKIMLEYAYRYELIEENPMNRVAKPSRKRKEKSSIIKTNYYTSTELQAFLSGAKKAGIKAYTIFYLLAYTGMRIGELLALTWSDINFQEKYIQINKTVSKDQNGNSIIDPPKTEKSNRNIYIDDAVIEVLKQWHYAQQKDLNILSLNPMNNDQLIFSNNNNELLENATVANMNVRICIKNHLRRITIHGFRHTHATLLLKAGVPIQTISARLGHANTQITLNTYVHVMEEQKKEVVNVLQDAMNGK